MAPLNKLSALVLLGTSALFCQTVNGQINKEGNKIDASAGVFPLKISDNRLPTWEDLLMNGTLYNLLFDKLMPTDYKTYVGPKEDFNQTRYNEQLQNFTQQLNRTWWENKTYTDLPSNETGRAASQYIYEKIAGPPDREGWAKGFDLQSHFSWAIYNLSQQILWRENGAWSGVGWNLQCAADINEILEEKGEWEKAGSAAATTLMALVPTLLAFGNLYVPRSSEAFSTSIWIGMSSALYSLGLPVKSISAVSRRNVIALSNLGWEALKTIESYAKPTSANLAALQAWTDDTFHSTMDPRRNDFAKIRVAVEEWQSRWHLWHLPALFVFGGQLIMAAVAIWPLFSTIGVPIYFFGCDPLYSWTAGYLIISSVLNAFFRGIMWLVGYHEIVKVFSLSKRAQEELRALIPTDLSTERCCSTANEPPPLHGSLLFILGGHAEHLWNRLLKRKDDRRQSLRLKLIEIDAKHSSISFFQKAWAITKFTFTKPLHLLLAGFAGIAVLVHLSVEARNFLMTLFTGFVEGALLIVLTFFFASQWGGNLVITCYAVSLLLVFVVLGRAVSLLYIRWSCKVYGLHVVECDSKAQILGSLRILASMQGVLVKMNGATYFDGIRVDKMKSYSEWQVDYHSGKFDSDVQTVDLPESSDLDLPIQGDEMMVKSAMIAKEESTTSLDHSMSHDRLDMV